MSYLNEKNGVSLSSIRKWILDKHPETKDKQKASFNSLTIKVRILWAGGGAGEDRRFLPSCCRRRQDLREKPHWKQASGNRQGGGWVKLLLFLSIGCVCHHVVCSVFQQSGQAVGQQGEGGWGGSKKKKSFPEECVGLHFIRSTRRSRNGAASVLFGGRGGGVTTTVIRGPFHVLGDLKTG